GGASDGATCDLCTVALSHYRTHLRTVVTIARSHLLIRGSAAGSQVLVEEIDRALPRQLGRRLVIARRRVVVEAVVGAGVHELLVLDVVRLQRLLEVWPSGVDAVVEPAIVNEQRRLDLRHVFRLRLASVVRRGRRK